VEGEKPAKMPFKQPKKSINSKIRERDRRLIFGEGITMAQVALTERIVLVGRVRGWNYTPMCLWKWMVENWGKLLIQLPGILSLSRGWFALFFSHPDQVE